MQLFPVSFACQASGVEPGDLFRGKLLFQEFIVLTWAAAQHPNSRLPWVRDHQRRIRAELYGGVMDVVHHELDPAFIGRRVVFL